ncbi:MAG: hypothetical protein ABIM74_03645 [candidate division WOR-3 bacterium]
MTSLFIAVLLGQNLWAKTYGGPSLDWAFSITPSTDGGYVVAGRTESFGAGLYDFLVLKLAPDGSVSWAKTFGGVNYDWGGYSVIHTTDGGYVVAGWTESFGAGLRDFLVLKLASDGSLEWARTYGGTGYDQVYSVIQTTDGGYVLAGEGSLFPAGMLVIKLASDGSVDWARTFGGTANNGANSVIQTDDGGYAVVGWTNVFGAGSYDIFILKLASDGSLDWARTYGGTDYDNAYSIIQTTDGGYAITGYTSSFGAGGNDLFILKLASDGSLDWARTYGGTTTDRGYSIIQTVDGGYAVAGFTYSFGIGNHLFILKLASDGSLDWARTFDGSMAPDGGYSLIQSPEGGYVVAATTAKFGAGGNDLFVIKLDSEGNYTDCVQSCSPTVMNIYPATSSPSVGVPCSPILSSPSLTITNPNLTITDACVPLFVEESSLYSESGITCSPLPAGALFISPEEMLVRIYKADGKLVYSGELRKGRNLINLDAGVYFWQAGQFKGKAVVR